MSDTANPIISAVIERMRIFSVQASFSLDKQEQRLDIRIYT
jgi:hypothetical protein